MKEKVKKIYKCGTLTYTRKGIVVLFAWLLWGDFCLTMFEHVRPVIAPLILRENNVSNLTIGLLCGSLPALLNFFVNPVISTASDRTRSRWGRRIPYLLFSAPFVSLLLVLLGFSKEIGTWLGTLLLAPGASPAPFIVGLLVVFSIGYLFFDLFAGCIYYYIFSDVVPQELTGRFIGFFRVVGASGGILFNVLVMPYIQLHMGLVCVISALVYLIGFGGMCLNVKEGEYPPPPPPSGHGMKGQIIGYMKECFSMPFWLITFIGFGLNYASSACRNVFNLLYSIEQLHMTTAQYGKVMAICSIITMGLSIPVGYLCDRFHPIRVYIGAAWLVILANIYGFFFCHDFPAFFAVSILLALVYVAQNGSRLPLAISMYPKERFGQFGSAASMVKALCMVLANAAGGWFIDLLGYQYIFVWDFVFTLFSVLILHWVYRRWKEYGGDKNYVPPVIH